MLKSIALAAVFCLSATLALVAQPPASRVRPPDAFGHRFDPPPPPPPPDVAERVPKGIAMERPPVAAALAASAGVHQYADSRTLVLIYNTYRKLASDPAPTHLVTSQDVQVLRDELDLSRRFVWRHSRSSFNLQVTDVVVLERELTLNQFWAVGTGAYWLPYWSTDGQHSVAQDIVDLGLINVGYDTVLVLYAWRNTADAGAAYGGAMYGVGIPALNGAGYIAIPLEWGIAGKHGTIIHEYLHILDSVFDSAGLPAFPNADQAGTDTGDYNFGWEFNVWMLQSWPRENFLTTGIYAPVNLATDADTDGLPDFGVDRAGAVLAVTEASVGTSPGKPDTDDDGLGDVGEMIAGIFEGSNPLVADTDGDGFRDGVDRYPLFPLRIDRPRGTPTIDGVIAPGEHRPLGTVRDTSGADLSAETFLEWDGSYLYVAARVTDDHVDGGFAEPWWNDHLAVRIDAANDGFQWHGNDNIEIFIGPAGTGGVPFVAPRILRADGTIDTTTLVAADLLYSVRLTPSGYELELAIPAIPTIGFTLAEGYGAGYSVIVKDFDAADWYWLDYDTITGRTEPRYAYADLTLTDASPTPAVTLKVNGQHPNPPIVATSGAVQLTLDVSPGAWNGTLQWYWALIVGGQIYWITANGTSLTAAPLVDMPPTTLAGVTLLEITLPAGAGVTSMFFLMDGATPVAFDWVAAIAGP